MEILKVEKGKKIQSVEDFIKNLKNTGFIKEEKQKKPK